MKNRKFMVKKAPPKKTKETPWEEIIDAQKVLFAIDAAEYLNSPKMVTRIVKILNALLMGGVNNNPRKGAKKVSEITFGEIVNYIRGRDDVTLTESLNSYSTSHPQRRILENYFKRKGIIK